MQYQILRAGVVVASVTPTGVQSKKIMGENICNVTFSLPKMVKFAVNDYMMVYGEKYILNDIPDVDKPSTIQYNYTCAFQGLSYQLAKVAFNADDADGNYSISAFDMMGNPDLFIDLLIENANRDQTGWVKGIVDVADDQLISFSNNKCLDVLATLSTTFGTTDNPLEYWIDGQTIHMTKKGVIQDLKFQYGQGKGLYDINRTSVTDKSLVTRLYAYGAAKNIPPTYKGYDTVPFASLRLRLPGSIAYIENNIYKNNNPADGVLYGVIEDSQDFEEIYPHRTGLITTLGADDFSFFDSEIDFDVNAYLIENVKAQVVFNTGDLAGYTFNIASFDSVTKEFRISTYTDNNGQVFPNDALKPGVGNQYVIVGISMPDSYVTDAENALLAAATAYLEANSSPIVTYGVICDIINFEARAINIVLGNYVKVIDTDFDLDDNIRINGFTRDLQVPYKYTMDLAELTAIDPIVRAAIAAETQVTKVERISKSVNTAYNNALQAEATAEGVKLITDYWGVTIDPDHGIIASGTLLVGSGALNNAGMTGVIDAGAESVRFWAGAQYEDKDSAPFRVLDDGSVFMTNANITGVINAVAGFFGNYAIYDNTDDVTGIINNDNTDVFFQIQKTTGDNTNSCLIILQNYNRSAAVADIETRGDGTGKPVALRVAASNGADDDTGDTAVALQVDGRLECKGISTSGSKAISLDVVDGALTWHFKNGLLIGLDS